MLELQIMIVGLAPDRENISVHGLDSLGAITKTIITKCLLQTDNANFQHFDAAE
jgi:hypothetical protein